jgi:hypothetical protein
MDFNKVKETLNKPVYGLALWMWLAALGLVYYLVVGRKRAAAPGRFRRYASRAGSYARRGYTRARSTYRRATRRYSPAVRSRARSWYAYKRR